MTATNTPATPAHTVQSTQEGFEVIDPAGTTLALRHTRRPAEAIARQLNGEPAAPEDTQLLAEPLYHREFGPSTKEKA